MTITHRGQSGYYLLAAGTFTYLAVWGLGANAGTAMLGLLIAIAAALLVVAARERKQPVAGTTEPSESPLLSDEERS